MPVTGVHTTAVSVAVLLAVKDSLLALSAATVVGVVRGIGPILMTLGLDAVDEVTTSLLLPPDTAVMKLTAVALVGLPGFDCRV
mgnify:CR=1 FL=1